MSAEKPTCTGALATVDDVAGLSWKTDDLWRQCGRGDQAAIKKLSKGDESDRATAQTVSKFLENPRRPRVVG